MKCDAYMHFAVMQLIPLFIKLVQQVICGRIPLAISVLQGTHLHLSEAKHMRVKRPAQGQNIESMSQRCVAKHENVHQVGIKPRSECTRQSREVNTDDFEMNMGLLKATGPA